MKNRIVFPNVPAARLWILVKQFAKPNGLRMVTDKDEQNALKIYCKAASILN